MTGGASENNAKRKKVTYSRRKPNADSLVFHRSPGVYDPTDTAKFFELKVHGIISVSELNNVITFVEFVSLYRVACYCRFWICDNAHLS
jgi:hypothetical protein